MSEIVQKNFEEQRREYVALSHSHNAIEILRCSTIRSNMPWFFDTSIHPLSKTSLSRCFPEVLTINSVGGTFSHNQQK